MNRKRQNADTATRLAREYADARYKEALIEKLQAGYGADEAEAETRRELSEPEAAQSLERDFRVQYPDAAQAMDEADARTAEGGRHLPSVAQKYGLNYADRRVGAALASDRGGDRVVDAVFDGDPDEAERHLMYVASRVVPEKFLETATPEEVEDAMKHGGLPTPEKEAQARYEQMTPEELDAEMEKEFGKPSGPKQVGPGVMFTTVQK